MAKTAPNFNVWTETGNLSDRPDISKVAGGIFYFAEDTNPQQLFFSFVDPNGVLPSAWVPIPVPTIPGWGKYVVSADPAVKAPYSTIGDAITAITASGFPTAAVLIHPGSYAEDVTIPNGVALSALGGLGSVVIAGTVNVGSDGSSNSMDGIEIGGELDFHGAGATLELTDCNVIGALGHDALVTSATDPTSRLIMTDCLLETQGDAGFLALREPDPCTVSAEDCTFFTGLGLGCIVARAPLVLQGGDVTGRVTQESGQFQAGADIHTSGIECILLRNGSQYIDKGGTILRDDNGPIITSDGSAGVVAFLGNKIAGASDRIDVSTRTQALRTIRPYQSFGIFNFPFNITPENPDVAVCENGAVDVVVNLDPVREFPDGQRRTIRRLLTATGKITINADPGGDTIEGQASLVIPVGPVDKSAGVTLQANHDNKEWLVINMDAP